LGVVGHHVGTKGVHVIPLFCLWNALLFDEHFRSY
jgi:hypothetical protein